MSNVITTLDVKFVAVEKLGNVAHFAQFDVRHENGTIVRDRFRGFVLFSAMEAGQRGIFEYDGAAIRVYAMYTGDLLFEMTIND